MYQTTLRNGCTKPKSTNNSRATLRQRQNYPKRKDTSQKVGGDCSCESSSTKHKPKKNLPKTWRGLRIKPVWNHNMEKLHDPMNLFRSTEFFRGCTRRHPQHAEFTVCWASWRRKPPTFEPWTPLGSEHGCRERPEIHLEEPNMEGFAPKTK